MRLIRGLGLHLVDFVKSARSPTASRVRHARVVAAALILFAVASGRTAAESPDAPQQVAPAVPATVYVFRAMGGKFITPEMDKLAARIEAQGFAVSVFNYTGWVRPAKEAIKRYRGEGAKTPIIAIGHSAGGDSAIRFALWLNKAGVPVDLVITLDPTRIANRVPANVERFINIYNSSHALGGGDPSPAPDFRGSFASIDLRNYSDIWHLYMPRMAGLQDQILNKIIEVAAQPSAAIGPTIPIEYTLPPDEPFELWDCGVAVVVDEGETPGTVAAQFGVPEWAVVEINQIPADRPLASGQQLVVPRHLDAASTN